MYSRKIIIYTLWLILSGILFASCVSTDKLIYLKDIPENNLKPTDKLPYIVKPRDLLYVRVASLDPKTTEVFNRDGGAATGGQALRSAAGLYIDSYIVSDSGFVLLPVLGYVYVAGNDISNIESILQEKINQYFVNAYVNVRLVNFKITILGEVAQPGVITVFDDEMTFFEALGQAGDLTSLANRERIKIIRRTEAGSVVNYVNVIDQSFITSDFYYLQPDDIVYVEPLRLQAFRLNTPTIRLILSGLSTTLVLLTFFIRLQ